MRALRRVKQSDIDKSDLLMRLAVQTYISDKQGQISSYTASEILDIISRTHTGILLTSGCIARQKQKRYNERNPFINTKWIKVHYTESFITQLALGVAFGIVLLFAWMAFK